ncbi:TPA: hypothetical protein HA251_04890 [Candidatus Woesearchaeota archaeon]|nr:hypothetical protein [Candidatus Woesearchaeota archaeon]
MNKKGPVTKYLRRNALPGIILHAYMWWHVSVFAMPRERLDWWPPYEAVPKIAYKIGDASPLNFLEPRRGTYQEWLRHRIEKDAPLPTVRDDLEKRVSYAQKTIEEPRIRDEVISLIRQQDPDYATAYTAREATIQQTIEDTPKPLRNRGHPGSLLYAIGAYALGRYHRYKLTKRRGSSK